jgi:hypothetical protein
MAFGSIGFSQSGDAAAPSGSIWGDCPNSLLEDLGLGYFGHEEFLGNTEIASFADASVFGSGKFNVDADTGALSAKASEVGGYATITTGANDNDAIVLKGQPLGAIVRNSGNKLWLEARIELATLFDGGVAFGLTTEANATRDIIADNPSNSVVAALTAATFIGFVTKQTASAIASIDAKYAKSTGTPVVVLTDVTNSTTLTAAGGTAAALAATTEVKLGVYFNGRDSLQFYVNGYKIGSVDVDSTVDQSSTLVPVLTIKTGTANAKAISADWVRYAFKART